VLITLNNLQQHLAVVLFLKKEFVKDAGTEEIKEPILEAVLQLDDGRDELNLAEFPLAAIADRVPDGQKTLVFEDEIFDSGKAAVITRRLTISASDKYGLPTSLDDEVILGLIQLTKQNRFAERKVNFSRYQLIQILGWRHEGRSYERLEKSLKRWLGVTLYYDKAWWDKEEQSWVDENFHILEQLTLYDQERRLKKLRSGKAELPLSSFTWNEVVFRSFKSGYLKAIDLGLFRQLEFAAAKRMYRFLDKRFYHRPEWEFDLTEFACEHIGLSRNYDTGQLKRRLQPAISELEQVGFLEPLPFKNRYRKITRGKWKVVFIKKAVPQFENDSASTVELVKKLVGFGVTPSVATQLVKGFPEELIELQIEVLIRLQTNHERESIRNPAGYLVKAIREGYTPPKEFVQKSKSLVRPQKNPRRSIELLDPMQKQIDEYLAGLSTTDASSLEAASLNDVEPSLADGYQRTKGSGGPTFQVYRRMVLERGAKRILCQTSGTKNAA
jgi:hypothetical protein